MNIHLYATVMFTAILPEYPAISQLTSQQARDAITRSISEAKGQSRHNDNTLSPNEIFSLNFSVDVSQHDKIFRNIVNFDGALNVASLKNDTFVKWTFAVNPSTGSAESAPRLGNILVAENINDLGIDGSTTFEATLPSISRKIPCNVTASTRLTLPYHGFPFIAACRDRSSSSATTIIAYDGHGDYRRIGKHPLLVYKINTAPILHGAGQQLIILAKSSKNQRTFLQYYSFG